MKTKIKLHWFSICFFVIPMASCEMGRSSNSPAYISGDQISVTITNDNHIYVATDLVMDYISPHWEKPISQQEGRAQQILIDPSQNIRYLAHEYPKWDGKRLPYPFADYLPLKVDSNDLFFYENNNELSKSFLEIPPTFLALKTGSFSFELRYWVSCFDEISRLSPDSLPDDAKLFFAHDVELLFELEFERIAYHGYRYMNQTGSGRPYLAPMEMEYENA